jgi:hypothetical protein
MVVATERKKSEPNLERHKQLSVSDCSALPMRFKMSVTVREYVPIGADRRQGSHNTTDQGKVVTILERNGQKRASEQGQGAPRTYADHEDRQEHSQTHSYQDGVDHEEKEKYHGHIGSRRHKERLQVREGQETRKRGRQDTRKLSLVPVFVPRFKKGVSVWRGLVNHTTT